MLPCPWLCCSRGAGDWVQPPPGAPRTALPHAAACPACSGTRNPWAWCSGGTRPQVTSSSSRCPHSPSWHRSLPRPEATRHRHREAGACPKPLGGSCCKQGRSWATGFGGPQAGGIRHRRAPPPGRLAVRGHGSYKLCGAPRGAGRGSFGISGLLGCQSCPAWGPTAAPLLPCTSSSSSSSQRPHAAAPHHRGLAHRQKTFH